MEVPPEDEPGETPVNQQQKESSFECNICFEVVSEPVVTKCGHLYCWPCLLEWMDRSDECPVCKGGISTESIVPLYGRGEDKETRRKAAQSRPRPQRERPRRRRQIPFEYSFFFNFNGLQFDNPRDSVYFTSNGEPDEPPLTENAGTPNPNINDEEDFVHMQHLPTCRHCLKLKPERTHHCSTCGQCILKYDHHCPWLGRCIGFHNYPYFIRYLIWLVLALGSLTIVWLLCDRPTSFLISKRHGLTVSVAVIISLTILISTHTFLIMKNFTTLEFMHFFSKGEESPISDASQRRRGIKNRAPYCRGTFFDNFQDVFGKQSKPHLPHTWIFSTFRELVSEMGRQEAATKRGSGENFMCLINQLDMRKRQQFREQHHVPLVIPQN